MIACSVLAVYSSYVGQVLLSVLAAQGDDDYQNVLTNTIILSSRRW